MTTENQWDCIVRYEISMFLYEIPMMCYDISMLCNAMVHVVKNMFKLTVNALHHKCNKYMLKKVKLHQFCIAHKSIDRTSWVCTKHCTMKYIYVWTAYDRHVLTITYRGLNHVYSLLPHSFDTFKHVNSTFF